MLKWSDWIESCNIVVLKSFFDLVYLYAVTLPWIFVAIIFIPSKFNCALPALVRWDLFVCRPPCWSRPWVAQKRMNWLRCGKWTMGTYGRHLANVSEWSVLWRSVAGVTEASLLLCCKVTVGYLRLSGGEVSCISDGLSVVHGGSTAATVVLLALLSTVLLTITALSVVCLLKRRWMPCVNTRKHRMEPNVLYTANVPLDPAASHNCTYAI